jgi:hypothetical protein
MGTAIGVIGILYARPALENETPPPPPPPIALFVGTNAYQLGRASLEVAIEANGCKNPVRVEGLLTRDVHAWRRPAGRSVPYELPTTAAVVIDGVRPLAAQMGFGDSQVPLIFPHRSGGNAGGEGAFEQPSLVRPPVYEDRHILNAEGIGRELRLPTYASPLVSQQAHPHTTRAEERSRHYELVHPAWGGMLLHSARWSIPKALVRFALLANLETSAGYNRCYITIPQVLAPESLSADRPFLYASRFLLVKLWGPYRHQVGDRIPYWSEITHAEIGVTVHGRIPTAGSIAPDGQITQGSLYYECNKSEAPAVVPHERVGPNANANCSDEPQFQAAGVAADVTQRIFAGGILITLAATLILETLFATVDKRPDQPEPEASRPT